MSIEIQLSPTEEERWLKKVSQCHLCADQRGKADGQAGPLEQSQISGVFFGSEGNDEGDGDGDRGSDRPKTPGEGRFGAGNGEAPVRIINENTLRGVLEAELLCNDEERLSLY